MKFYRDKNRKVIEGFLGDSKECEMLFILREPNNNGEEPKDFWFRKVLAGDVSDAKSRRNGSRYIGVLGRLYNLIKGKNNINKSALIDNLKRCCYINIHPHFGYSTASKEYKVMLEDFRNKKSEASHNRWDIIDELIHDYGCKYIITVEDIFSAICSSEDISVDVGLVCGDKVFRSGKYKGATVYEFYHPSYPMSYNKISMRGKL